MSIFGGKMMIIHGHWGYPVKPHLALPWKRGKHPPDGVDLDPQGMHYSLSEAYAGEEKMVDVLLTSDAAKQLQNIGTLSALMWAHWCPGRQVGFRPRYL
jgi:hypothetical protein